MSVQSQRSKVKSTMRFRNQRPPNSQTNALRLPYNQYFSEDNLGIFSNSDLTHVLCQLVIGNVGKVLTTENENLLGLIKAISPSADLGLSCVQIISKNDKSSRKNVSDHIISWNKIKMIRIPNVKLTDCLINELKTDIEISRVCETNSASIQDKELVPFFVSSEKIDDFEILESSSNVDRKVFPAKEMFETNAKLFSVCSTYNEDLREYTTPVDKSDPNYPELEAKCAKIAQEMMESQSRVDEESDLKIDEEDQFSAVSRILPSAINRFSQRRISHRNEAVVNNVGHQLSQVSIQASKCSSSEISTSNIIVNGNVTDSNPSTVNSTNRLPNQLSNDKSKLNDRFSEVSSQSNFSTIVSGTTPTQSKSIERVKKSTLDPNAPEFQPMGLAYVSVHSNPVATQAMQSSVIPTTHSIHVSQHYAAMTQSSHVPSQTAFIARSQFYAPVLPYAAQQTGQLQQLLSTPASVCIPGSIPQHMRGGSLPPSLNQQHFTQSAATNHGLNLLSQQHAQSGASFAQMITAPQSLVFAGNNSAVRLPVCPPSSSIGLTRQRSNDSPSSVSHPISYAIQQPVMSMTTFQPPVYQIPQGNGGIPFIVSGHHPLGLQLVPAGLPNAANSSPLMVGNVNVSQATNQQGYPGHTIMHMQPATHLQMPMAQSDQIPTPSTTPQQTIQSQQQQQQQMYSQHYQDHSHHIQVPSYAGPYHNLMFASQQGGGASNFYPTVAPSTMLTGPNAVNPSIASAAAAGLFPILGQPNYQQQHSMGANIQHQHNQMDPSQLLMNGQHHPHQMALTNNNQHHHHQLFQHQAAMAQAQLLQAHHMNNSHIPTANTYHAFIAAMSAAGGAAATGVGNATPQAH